MATRAVPRQRGWTRDRPDRTRAPTRRRHGADRRFPPLRVQNRRVQAKPLSDAWQQGNPYERYVGRWSRCVAPPFLAWLDAPRGRRWLDIGCGTGALCAAVAEHCAPASLTGVEPSEGFLKLARETLGDRAELHVGNAASIPVGSASAEVVVSGLVLNFIPDLPAALAETTRVGVKGALFGAYVWDYAGRMDLMRHFWDAAVALDASAAGLDEGVRFPLCQPDALRTALIDAGYTNPEVTAIAMCRRYSPASTTTGHRSWAGRVRRHRTWPRSTQPPGTSCAAPYTGACPSRPMGRLPWWPGHGPCARSCRAAPSGGAYDRRVRMTGEPPRQSAIGTFAK